MGESKLDIKMNNSKLLAILVNEITIFLQYYKRKMNIIMIILVLFVKSLSCWKVYLEFYYFYDSSITSVVFFIVAGGLPTRIHYFSGG